MNYSSANYNFSGNVAVVTGGAQGIGAEVVQRLRADSATVVVWDLPRFAPTADDGLFHAVDVSDRDCIARATDALKARWGHIDYLVNNAGFAGSTVTLDAYDPAEWQRIIEVNLVGVFNVCRAIVPLMRSARQGRIVNIASLAGKEGTANASAYSASKAGVIALTKSLGKELATSGVLVNAIAPAAIRTGLLAQMSPEHVQIMIDKSPMKRLGEPAEVAEMVAWLCSGSCTFNTGAVFDLSGGRATY
ncbi:MAG: SDR family NAD(P)-dependent oxidoreductase [Burkholderiales bacterium]